MVSAYLGFLHANQPTHTPQVQGSFQQKLFPVGYEKPNPDQLIHYQASTYGLSQPPGGIQNGTKTNYLTEPRILRTPTGHYLGVSPFFNPGFNHFFF